MQRPLFRYYVYIIAESRIVSYTQFCYNFIDIFEHIAQVLFCIRIQAKKYPHS